VSRKAAQQRSGRELEPFANVVAQYGKPVYGFLVAMVGSQRAEDCWQETFCAALAAYPSVRDPAAVRSWLFTIAQRKAVDTFRSNARDVPYAEVPERMTDGAFGTTSDVWDLVAGLSPKQRLAIFYRFIGDLAYSEIAEVMGITQEAARRNVFEGLRALRTRRDTVHLVD
jgi:RNA polymerase sigma factor (sigma-70 family)